MDQMLENVKPKITNKHSVRKRLLGLILGLVLAIIVLNIDKKLWWPLELETINGRNTSKWLNRNELSTDQVIIILFDDKTQFLLRRNGLPIKDLVQSGRDLIESAIEKLESSGVKTIGIDLINLSNPSSALSDEKLRKTIAKYKNIVFADSIYSSYPTNKILKSKSIVGYGELYPDYDKVVHKIKLVDKDYKDTPSFSYALFKNAYHRDVDQKLKKRNEIYLRYSKTPFVQYSFVDLIQGKVMPSLLKDKIVIVGIGLKSKLIKDQLFSPFDKTSFIFGSEVKATALVNLLSNFYLTKLSTIDYSLLFIFLSVLLGVLFSNITPMRSFVLGVLLFVGLIIFSQVAYSYSQTIIELVPLLFLLLGNLVIGSLVFLQLNLQEQNIELEDTLRMLNKRSKELEVSRAQLENKNTQLTLTLSELNNNVQELRKARKMLSGRREEERKRIARELHDDTLSRITDLKRYIESIINSSNVPVSEKKQLGISIQILNNVTHEIRRIINALRPSMLDNVLGLIPAIENLLDELAKRSNHKIQTKLTTKLPGLKFSELCEINLYRIVQEALNNVFKHSYATKVEILIEEQPGQILILINDNGIGFGSSIRPDVLTGFGLVDMRERAELIGANVQYLNKPKGTGATLEVTMPIDRVEQFEKKEMSKEKIYAT